MNSMECYLLPPLKSKHSLPQILRVMTAAISQWGPCWRIPLSQRKLPCPSLCLFPREMPINIAKGAQMPNPLASIWDHSEGSCLPVRLSETPVATVLPFTLSSAKCSLPSFLHRCFFWKRLWLSKLPEHRSPTQSLFSWNPIEFGKILKP